MGKWNRRYLDLPRRKKFRHYDWEDEDPSNSSAFSCTKGIPSWEVDYCYSAKVPWKKIMASKRYICCYPSVLHWDASAAQVALESAKERYLAMISGSSFDTPLPDPNIYIDEIDWNPFMDPELLAEVDLLHFDPDKLQEEEKLELQKDESAATNPWEGNQEKSTLKDALHGWGTWDDSVNITKDNSCIQGGYKSSNDSWNTRNDPWNTQQRSSSFIDYGCSNSWTNSKQKMTSHQEGWGSRHNNISSWNHVKPGARSGYDADFNNGWRGEKNGSWITMETDKYRVWGDNNRESSVWRNESWGRNQNFNHNRRQFNDSYRKRERPLQQTTTALYTVKMPRNEIAD